MLKKSEIVVCAKSPSRKLNSRRLLTFSLLENLVLHECNENHVFTFLHKTYSHLRELYFSPTMYLNDN